MGHLDDALRECVRPRNHAQSQLTHTSVLFRLACVRCPTNLLWVEYRQGRAASGGSGGFPQDGQIPHHQAHRHGRGDQGRGARHFDWRRREPSGRSPEGHAGTINCATCARDVRGSMACGWLTFLPASFLAPPVSRSFDARHPSLHMCGAHLRGPDDQGDDGQEVRVAMALRRGQGILIRGVARDEEHPLCVRRGRGRRAHMEVLSIGTEFRFSTTNVYVSINAESLLPTTPSLHPHNPRSYALTCLGLLPACVAGWSVSARRLASVGLPSSSPSPPSHPSSSTASQMKTKSP